MAVAVQNIDIMAELAKLTTSEGREETVAWVRPFGPRLPRVGRDSARKLLCGL